MRCAFLQPTFIVRQSCVGSRSVHTDNPQGGRRAVASKTAPSQPKHDGAESQRGLRHVSSCRLIPACAKKKRGLRRHKEPRCPVSTSDVIHRRGPKKQQQGRWKEGQRSPQECHRHVCYRIFSTELHDRARACALLRLRLGHFQPRITRSAALL